ncbi:hypothetical protein HJC23_010216 [Cyclotella cryptica]|uniref:Uncharacterized protein n=1 Tax=Cyclotella cryptica TaxID=29204 RepID=A0ABD3NK87_9STRA
MRSDIWDKYTWSADDLESMKQSVLILAEAAGDSMGSTGSTKKSLDDILQDFETGTQGRKEWKQWFKIKPKPGDYCSITDVILFDSISTQAKNRLNSSTIGKRTEIENNEQDDFQRGDIVEPNYVEIGLLLNVAGFEQDLDSKAVAWGLIKLRFIAQRESRKIKTNALISKSNHLSKGWNDLMLMATKRSYPSNNTLIESIPTPTAISTPMSQRNPLPHPQPPKLSHRNLIPKYEGLAVNFCFIRVQRRRSA